MEEPFSKFVQLNNTGNRYKIQDASQNIQDTSVRVHSLKVSNGFSISRLAQLPLDTGYGW